MKHLANVLGVAALFTVFSTAQAAPTGWYAGLSLGQSDYDVSTSDFDDGGVISGSVDETDTGMKLFFGNRVNENVSIEFGYLDLGEATLEGVSDGTGFFWFPGDISADVEGDGIHLAILGNIPVSDRFELMAKAGFLMWDLSIDLTDSWGTVSADEDGTDLFFGVGLNYAITDKVSIRGEWELYTVDIGASEEIDINLLSAGVTFRF